MIKNPMLRYRQELGLSQREAASDLGISYSAVRTLEYGTMPHVPVGIRDRISEDGYQLWKFGCRALLRDHVSQFLPDYYLPPVGEHPFIIFMDFMEVRTPEEFAREFKVRHRTVARFLQCRSAKIPAEVHTALSQAEFPELGKFQFAISKFIEGLDT